MKTHGRYYFDTKTEMNDWISATHGDHTDQAEIENDPDFYMLIATDDHDLFYAEYNSYYAGIDDTDWPETGKYQVIV